MEISLDIIDLDRCVSHDSQSNHNDKIEKVESELLKFEQIDCPLRHMFAPGVYVREITMPKGSVIIGHEHKTEHFNIVLKGSAKVVQDDKIELIEAPCIFVSKAGVRKVLHILEEMIWATVHVTDKTTQPELEKELIKKSDSWLNHNSITNNQSKEIE